MAFWNKKASSDLTNVRLPGDNSFRLAIVGESHYQEALEVICGGRTEDGVDQVVSARLVAEDSNPYDPQAVHVEVGGKHVGYLSRQDARAYRDYMGRNGIGSSAGWCPARIRGGWERGGGDFGHFGVQLDLLLYG